MGARRAAHTQGLDLDVPDDERAYSRAVSVHDGVVLDGDALCPAGRVRVRIAGRVVVECYAARQDGVERGVGADSIV